MGNFYLSKDIAESITRGVVKQDDPAPASAGDSLNAVRLIQQDRQKAVQNSKATQRGPGPSKGWSPGEEAGMKIAVVMAEPLIVDPRERAALLGGRKSQLWAPARFEGITLQRCPLSLGKSYPIRFWDGAALGEITVNKIRLVAVMDIDDESAVKQGFCCRWSFFAAWSEVYPEADPTDTLIWVADFDFRK